MNGLKIKNSNYLYMPWFNDKIFSEVFNNENDHPTSKQSKSDS